MSPNAKGEIKKKVNNNNIYSSFSCKKFLLIFSADFGAFSEDFFEVENVVRFSLLHMFFVLFSTFLEILAVLSHRAVKLSNFYA
jgi:hypothetical protein